MIRVELPHHLRMLAQVNGEVMLEVEEPVTLRRLLDALEEEYPVLRGTIRDHDTLKRRPFLRFFACQEDLSHDSPDDPLPAVVAAGKEPLLIVGAIAGGTAAQGRRRCAANSEQRPGSKRAGFGGISVQKIKPFLWFNDNAEEAVDFYVSVFKNARKGEILRSGEGGPGKPGSVLTASFFAGDLEFVALNGGPHFSFTEAISFVVPCDSQAEIDEMWEKLTDGGKEVQCGWLKDRFGLSWQIVPRNIAELLQGKDAEGGKRAMQAMMQMIKLDIAALEHAGGRS